MTSDWGHAWCRSVRRGGSWSGASTHALGLGDGDHRVGGRGRPNRSTRDLGPVGFCEHIQPTLGSTATNFPKERQYPSTRAATERVAQLIAQFAITTSPRTNIRQQQRQS